MHRRRHHRRRRTGTRARGHRGEPGLRRCVSLVVPGIAADFAGYSNDDLPPAPALSLWLRRAAVDDFPAALTEQAVATLCGIDAGDNTPVAYLTYLEDFGELPQGYCLRADPVHLRADTTGLVLFDAASFELDEAESRALCGTLAVHLAEDGWTLKMGHPQRWYLTGPEPQDLDTLPLPLARGSAVPAVSLSGRDAKAWTTRVNELQMLMHGHPVNQARAANRQVAINSLWLWGGGEPRLQAEAKGIRVCADNVFARGCARYRGFHVSQLPEDADQLAATLKAAERLLAVVEHCRDAAAYQDLNVWRAGMERLERNWFAPLVQSLRRGVVVDALDLYPLNGWRYRLTRAQLRSFWKGRGDYRLDKGFPERLGRAT